MVKKLQEHWAGRKGECEKLIMSGKRPDLLEGRAKKESRAAAREAYGRVMGSTDATKCPSVAKSNTTVAKSNTLTKCPTSLSLDNFVESSEVPDVDSIINEVFTPAVLRKKLMGSESPAILQWFLNRKFGQDGKGGAVIVEPRVFRLVRDGENIRGLGPSTLDSIPSGLGEGLNIPRQTEDSMTPTPPKSPIPSNQCISSENDFGNFESDEALTPQELRGINDEGEANREGEG